MRRVRRSRRRGALVAKIPKVADDGCRDWNDARVEDEVDTGTVRRASLEVNRDAGWLWLNNNARSRTGHAAQIVRGCYTYGVLIGNGVQVLHRKVRAADRTEVSGDAVPETHGNVTDLRRTTGGGLH